MVLVVKGTGNVMMNSERGESDEVGELRNGEVSNLEPYLPSDLETKIVV